MRSLKCLRRKFLNRLEIDGRQLGPIVLPPEAQELRDEVVRLLAEQPVGHVQREWLIRLVQRRPEIAKQLVEEVLLDLGKLHHAAHLRPGFGARSEVGHRERNGDAERGDEDVAGVRRTAQVEVEGEPGVGGGELGALGGVLEDGFGSGGHFCCCGDQ